MFYLQDEPPPNDADLQLHGPYIPDSENGLRQMEKLPDVGFSFGDDWGDSFAEDHGITDDSTIWQIEQGFARNDTVVDAFLAQAQPAFAQLDAILALPHFDAAKAFLVKMEWFNPNPAYAAAIALRLEVVHSLQKDDAAIATKDTLRLRLLVSRLTEGYSYGFDLSPVPKLCDDYAASARDLLNAPALSASQQNALTRAFAVNEPAMSSFQRSLAFQYQIFLVYLQHDLTTFDSMLYVGPLTSGPGSPGPTFGANLDAHWLHITLKPNLTRRLLADHYRGLIQALNGPYARIDFSALKAGPQGYAMPGARPPLGTLFVPNAGGRYFLSEGLLHSPSELLRTPYQVIAADRLGRTGFALRSYYKDHGALPPTLAALVPQYLPAVPADPFDGQSLRYDPARGLVYSVGTTLKDTHGSRFLTMPPSDPNYQDPLLDEAQPTLLLAFPKKP